MNKVEFYVYTATLKDSDNKVITIHSMSQLTGGSYVTIGGVVYTVWSKDGYNIVLSNLSERAVLAYKVVK